MKMIQFKYAIISTAFLLGGMTTGCDTLDIDNLETYDESMVWGDLNLAQAYVNNLYEVHRSPHGSDCIPQTEDFYPVYLHGIRS